MLLGEIGTVYWKKVKMARDKGTGPCLTVRCNEDCRGVIETWTCTLSQVKRNIPSVRSIRILARGVAAETEGGGSRDRVQVRAPKHIFST